MVVNVVGIHVRSHHALIALEVLRELDTDLVSGIEVQRTVRSKRLDDVVVAPAVCFTELLFHSFKFLQRCPGHAVDAADERIRGFLSAGDIVQNILQATRDSNEFNVCHVLSYTSMNGSMSTSPTRPCRAMTVS